ncbi:hypothetical protein LOD99_946 [Oopsacas minuta]|uniref:Uncharacterized protein n=1 Tax=Oopsacas minuta TaxID=111878 RepID=A0AAV7K1R1_9METZ|nr:hypothetical protein LOD99_946 [Oopsacas minuta]
MNWLVVQKGNNNTFPTLADRSLLSLVKSIKLSYNASRETKDLHAEAVKYSKIIKPNAIDSFGSVSRKYTENYLNVFARKYLPPLMYCEYYKYALIQIKYYLQTNLLSGHGPIPPWISDRLLAHIVTDEECPNEFFKGFFSSEVCSLLNIEITNRAKLSLLINRRLLYLSATNITKLDLSHCHCIDDTLIESYSKSRAANSLIVLKLRGCELFTNISCLGSFVNLYHLDLSENYSLNFKSNSSFTEILYSLIHLFPNILILDLHFTKFIARNWDIQVHSSDACLFSTLKIQQLYLYTDIRSEGIPCTQNLKVFYSSITSLPSLTHLDLSGWPYLNQLSSLITCRQMNKLLFFGTYKTSLTGIRSEFDLTNCEITGMNDEEQIISTLSHYSHHSNYLNDLYKTLEYLILHHSLVNLSGETIQQLIRLIIASVEHHLSEMTSEFISTQSSFTFLTNAVSCILELFFYEQSQTGQFPCCLRQRDIELLIIVLYRINSAYIDETVAYLAYPTIMCIAFSLENRPIILQESMVSICSQFMSSSIEYHLLNPSEHTTLVLVNAGINVVGALVFSAKDSERGKLGIKLEEIGSLVKLLRMKLFLFTFDEPFNFATKLISHLAYQHFATCIYLCVEEHRKVLIRIIEDCTEKAYVVSNVLLILKNIAWFCYNHQESMVVSKFLPVIVHIFSNPLDYSQQTKISAIAFTAFYALGQERWNWEESSEEALSYVEATIGELDYKSISVNYEHMDIILKCYTSAKDPRVNICALFLLCTISTLQLYIPEHFVIMLSQSIATTRSFASKYPPGSLYYTLAEKIISLVHP